MSSTYFYIASTIWPTQHHTNTVKLALNTKIKKFPGPQRVFTSFSSYSKCLHEPYNYPLWRICRNLEGLNTICTSLPTNKRSLAKKKLNVLAWKYRPCWPAHIPFSCKVQSKRKKLNPVPHLVSTKHCGRVCFECKTYTARV